MVSEPGVKIMTGSSSGSMDILREYVFFFSEDSCFPSVRCSSRGVFHLFTCFSILPRVLLCSHPVA